jgi:hypothetical protein
VKIKRYLRSEGRDVIKDDNVNHPVYYTSAYIESFEVIKASMNKEAFKGFLKGNRMKYLLSV